ncbi:cathepsin L-like [Vanessa atalanta]|uniref:cathepsin L-like n=1 Tax=Vanessa atalanta TaxID=42275 RepID=UPI001FCCD539|nr:cathepsin L-like [Vanessa atalanta]
MRSLAVLMVVVVVVGADSFVDLIREEWNAFKLKHKKSYENETEDRFRMKIYAENKLKMAKHNRRFERGEVTYRLGVNKYADKLQHEFVHSTSGINFKAKLDWTIDIVVPPIDCDPPNALDWRSEGAVTEVKDQGDCSAGYAFSTAGSMEGMHFRSSGDLVSLSAQNLIDCSLKFWNHGCDGGHVGHALLYILNSGGINTEESYPYEGVVNNCRFDPANEVVSLLAYNMFVRGDEEIMKKVVVTMGPISAMIDASQVSFQLYSSGVYYDEDCSSSDLNHGVLVVGYDTDEEGGDYWLVKNSWGTSWGEDGYIKMARNRGNNCGIASYIAYPFI